MGGRIKALARLGGQTLLERAAAALRQGGVSTIVAVTGHDRERVGREAARLGIRTVVNPDIDRGMFSSVQTGLAALVPEAPDAVLILPVDAALVLGRTVAALLALREETALCPPILVPTFLDLPGHPVLAPAAHFDPILRWSGKEGLRGYLASLPPPPPGTAPPLRLCPLPDAGIGSDVDTPAHLAEAEVFLEETDNRGHPSLEEAWQELILAGLSGDKVRHSLYVAVGAARLARGLEAGAFSLPAGPGTTRTGTRLASLCLRAGLLHDIRRNQPDHAARGAERLAALGWQETALAVGAHTLPPSAVLAFFGLEGDGATASPSPPDGDGAAPARRALAAACVYLADKLTLENGPGPSQERFARAKTRFAGNPEALAAVSRRETLTLALENWFAGALSLPPLELIRNTPPDREEDRLAALSAQLAEEEAGPCGNPSST
jgi:CTP:molybdopterin cytidylyltransferase MocA